MEENQSLLKFLSGKSRKYNLPQRLVYNSNISVNKICTSKEFSELFRLAKLEIPTYSDSILFVKTFVEFPYFLLNVFVKTFVKHFLLKQCVLCKL